MAEIEQDLPTIMLRKEEIEQDLPIIKLLVETRLEFESIIKNKDDTLKYEKITENLNDSIGFLKVKVTMNFAKLINNGRLRLKLSREADNIMYEVFKNRRSDNNKENI